MHCSSLHCDVPQIMFLKVWTAGDWAGQSPQSEAATHLSAICCNRLREAGPGGSKSLPLSLLRNAPFDGALAVCSLGGSDGGRAGALEAAAGGRHRRAGRGAPWQPRPHCRPAPPLSHPLSFSKLRRDCPTSLRSRGRFRHGTGRQRAPAGCGRACLRAFWGHSPCRSSAGTGCPCSSSCAAGNWPGAATAAAAPWAGGTARWELGAVADERQLSVDDCLHPVCAVPQLVSVCHLPPCLRPWSCMYRGPRGLSGSTGPRSTASALPLLLQVQTPSSNISASIKPSLRLWSSTA